MKQKLFSLIGAAMLLMSAQTVKAAGAEVYTVYRPVAKTLTYYYDDKKSTYTQGIVYVEDYNPKKERFSKYADQVETIVIDYTMKKAGLTTMKYLFCGGSKESLYLKNVKKITDFDNLRTDKVTDMSYMFCGCSKLTSLNLTWFNLSCVKNVSSMFANCSALKTIYSNDSWKRSGLTSSANMFLGCTSLEGGNGTKFNTSFVDNSYANPDNPEDGHPGYFTQQHRVYTTFDSSSGVLTYYYGYSWPYSLDTASVYRWNDEDMLFANHNAFDAKKVKIDVSMRYAALETMKGLFWMLPYVTEIVGILNLNTSKVTDMRLMFYDCASLQSVDLSSFNTSNVTDMSCMFYNCTSLQSLDLRSFNTSNVTNMNAMFKGCESLQSVDLSLFNTSNVTDMNGMFKYCTSLKSLDLRPFNTSNVTNMRSMFDDCNSLQSIDLSSFNTSNVTDMHMIFFKCESLQSIDLSSFNTSNTMNMSQMFDRCTSLQSIDLSSFNTSNVTDMGRMFADCTSLQSIDLSSFSLKKETTFNFMFDGCSSLKTIYCNYDWSAQSSDNGEYMFRNCTSLTGGKGTKCNGTNNIDASYAHPDKGTTNPGYFTELPKEIYTEFVEATGTLTYYYDSDRKSRLGITDTYDPVNKPDVLRFDTYYEKVVKAVVDVSMQDAPLTSTRNMFYGGGPARSLKKLTTITGLDNLNTENVTNMSQMFYNCYKLTTLDISSFNINQVSDISRMFYYCQSLTTIYCNDDWSQSNVITSSSSMFNACYKLVGENGTKCNGVSNVGITYARPDNGPESTQPGYFTRSGEGIENIVAPTDKAHKIMMEGVLYITTPDGAIYDAQGTRVR